VCIPTDEFDFRFGAKLALHRALNATFSQKSLWTLIMNTSAMVSENTKAKIWNKFNELVPPTK
jgi:hypothetical protein